MTKEIEGVPESITREAYREVYKSLGLDPYSVSELLFRPDGISATVFARDTEGKFVVDRQRGEAVFHEVYIPVEDEER